MDAAIGRSGLRKYGTVAREDWTEAVRAARYGWLSELPGLAFGIITIVYIVTSLIALA